VGFSKQRRVERAAVETTGVVRQRCRWSVFPKIRSACTRNRTSNRGDEIVKEAAASKEGLGNDSPEPNRVLRELWHVAGLDISALDHITLRGVDPVLPSSFAIGTGAVVSVAAAALAACEFDHVRGAPRQRVGVNMRHAALECAGRFSIGGRSPELFDALSGLYRCRNGWVRLHAVFEHHRRGALQLLGLDPSNATRTDIAAALSSRQAEDFENSAADAGLVVTKLRTFEEWDASPQGRAVAAAPLFSIEQIGDAPPRDLQAVPSTDLPGAWLGPLTGVRVIDATRILAGPVGGRTLAGYGADVMLVNAPHLPNIEAIAETSRGKLSSHVDLAALEGRSTFEQLLSGSDVLVQGYRPGAFEKLGFGPADVAHRHPGTVYVTLSAYGREGPWATRRGFDSLVQTAMGFNAAEGIAAGEDQPRAFPMQVIDYCTGFLVAMCVSAALIRQRQLGGTWHVNVSLAQTGHWLRGLGRVKNGFAVSTPSAEAYQETSESGFGSLRAIRHSANLSRTPVTWPRPSMPPGSHPPAWPDRHEPGEWEKGGNTCHRLSTGAERSPR
jgi:crotonobetainyl-CoA:carnitine CoA-transferase CaiB-like acyl-CoA transferase